MSKNLLINDQVHLYGDVGDPYGWGDGFTPLDVAQALAEYGAGDVTVRINSGGGLAYDGMAIYSLLRAHVGEVTVVVDGVAASAASLIAMAGAKREMRDGAMMMIHDASGITFGPAASHRKSAEVLEKLSDNYAHVYALRSGLDRKEARELMLATTWLTADEAIEKGFATAKVSDVAEAYAAFDYRVYGAVRKDCPLRVRGISDGPVRKRAHEKVAIAAVRAAQTRMRMRSRGAV